MRKIIIFLLILFLVGCKSKDNKEIKIAEQYGLAYAPLQIMKEEGLLEKKLGDEYTVTWVKLSNTAAIREAMLADDLDLGFVGIPPFLIGVDQNMPWKIMTGLSVSPLGLVTDDESIVSLEDLIGRGKIALPQPGSIQHILLAMAAKNIIGQADIFDNQLVSMSHPDGLQALFADTQVKAYFASPPYLFQALEHKENHVILTGEEAMGGPFTFIVGVCPEEFYENKECYKAFFEALNEGITFINESPDETAEILAKSYELDKDVIKNYLYEQDIDYTNKIMGLEKFSSFMYEEGYIENQYTEDEVIWDY